LGTLAELDDRSMSATARRLIETEAATRRDEIDKYLRTQSRKTAAEAPLQTKKGRWSSEGKPAAFKSTAPQPVR
jgi:hypothetical protein